MCYNDYMNEITYKRVTRSAVAAIVTSAALSLIAVAVYPAAGVSHIDSGDPKSAESTTAAQSTTTAQVTAEDSEEIVDEPQTEETNPTGIRQPEPTTSTTSYPSTTTATPDAPTTSTTIVIDWATRGACMWEEYGILGNTENLSDWQVAGGAGEPSDYPNEWTMRAEILNEVLPGALEARGC